MAAPDDDHVCQPMYGADGELVAMVHGSPDMSDRAREALAELVAAARRRFAEDDADGELARRQGELIRRIRERRVRLLGESDGHA